MVSFHVASFSASTSGWHKQLVCCLQRPGGTRYWTPRGQSKLLKKARDSRNRALGNSRCLYCLCCFNLCIDVMCFLIYVYIYIYYII